MTTIVEPQCMLRLCTSVPLQILFDTVIAA